MKAMGQMGHLWKTSQCDVWMCDLIEFTPPNTTAQLGHLWGEHGRSRGEAGHLYALPHPMLILKDWVDFEKLTGGGA